ncbi:hypothetical protein E2542_SST22408 [Spatholobus suberectus]|nr:hypothetical protein E2542_SST22408 [Spatholobus suberectus]
MGGSVKHSSSISESQLIGAVIYYSFADSTHSYDFLWFLSFHSPLRSPLVFVSPLV